MRLFENANYSFIRYRKIGYAISIILVLISLTGILWKGLQYGIEFRGGIEVLVSFHEAVNSSEVQTLLSDAMDTDVRAKRFGSGNDLLIRIRSDLDLIRFRAFLGDFLSRTYPDNPFQILQVDLVGPSFVKEVRNAAFQASFFSIAVIGIYIFARFRKLAFSLSVLTALGHDLIIILGIFSVFNGIFPFSMDIDQNLIAAFLTIIGYSLNDTIVVFDRIRENQRIFKTEPYNTTVNKSINQTLSRTVVTSLTTLFVIVILFFFGGAVLKGFSFALIAGIILGTYSTIYIACPLLVDLEARKKKSVLHRRKFLLKCTESDSSGWNRLSGQSWRMMGKLSYPKNWTLPEGSMRKILFKGRKKYI